MKKLFLFPLMFFKVCWYQGISRALLLTRVTLRDMGLRFGKSKTLQFPPIPSNSSSYLHLLEKQPLVSVVMPVYNSPWLAEAVNSVLEQSYRNFELILVNDCSTNADMLTVLQRISGHEKVRVLHNAENLGTSGSTNVGVEAAAGEYVAFMDHDDLIHPDALALFARTVNSGQDAEVYYSDEERMDSNGAVVAHMRKCSVSMDLLLSCNSVLHFCIVKKSALDKLGPLNSAYDGAQDHDLMIRALEQGMRFCHMPYIMYAWRIHGASTSSNTRTGAVSGEQLPKAYLSGRKLITDYLARNHVDASVTEDCYPWYRVRYRLPDPAGHVAILVPFKDKIGYLKTLLGSMQKTSYPDYTMVLINNRSELPETAEYLKEIQQQPNVRVVDFDEPFNYSRLYNRVVESLDHELLLFMNNDIEVKEPDWLQAMLEHIHRPKIGAVGCRLIRGDGSIQHAGMTFKPSVFSCAMNVYLEEEYYTKTQRDVSGVTAACMLTRKSVFTEIGGFDEINFPIGFSDADLCLRMKKAGYRIVYTPFAELYHHESITRKVQEESYELYNLFTKYIGDSPMVDRHYHSMFM